MIKYILIALISYILGASTLIIYSVLKVSSECSRNEEKQKFIDYGKVAYEELERREQNKNEVLND